MVKIKMTLPDPPETDGSLKGSSPVRGNAYAGFLGGWGLATVSGYPTVKKGMPMYGVLPNQTRMSGTK